MASHLNHICSSINRVCPICRLDDKTPTHLFCHCQFTNLIWSIVKSKSLMLSVPSSDSFFGTWFWSAKKGGQEMEAILAWYIWRSRNLSVFQTQTIDLFSIFTKSLTLKYQQEIAWGCNSHGLHILGHLPRSIGGH